MADRIDIAEGPSTLILSIEDQEDNSLYNPWRHPYHTPSVGEKVVVHDHGDPEEAVVLSVDNRRERALISTLADRRRWVWFSMVRRYKPPKPKQPPRVRKNKVRTGRPLGRPRKCK